MTNVLVAVAWWYAGISPHGFAAFQPSALENQTPALFRLEPATFPYQLTIRWVTERYAVWNVQFPSPIVTPYPQNNTVHAEWFRPHGAGKRPGVVVLHILGADFALSRYMAARLADQGISALFVKLPYYGERQPPGVRNRLISGDIERSVQGMRQGVCDVRRAAAWLKSRAEIDPKALGVAGISLGGIIGALAASADPEIQNAALLLAGGDLAEILWGMDEPEARQYRAAWNAAGRTRDDLEKLTRPLDPLTYADKLKTKNVFMLAGNADETIPPICALKLWRAAGRPRLVWADCGHYSSVGYLLPGIRQTVDFFKPGAREK